MKEAALTVALSRSDAAFLTEMLQTAVADNPSQQQQQQAAAAGTAAALGHLERKQQQQQQAPSPGRQCPYPVGGRMEVQVLLCALREDMRKLPSPLPLLDIDRLSTLDSHKEAEEFVRARPYLTCCVRLSPEKEPDRFVSLVEELARRGVFRQPQHGVAELMPLLIGSSNDAYSQVCASPCSCPERQDVNWLFFF
jgi:hypothetical protein